MLYDQYVKLVYNSIVMKNALPVIMEYNETHPDDRFLPEDVIDYMVYEQTRQGNAGNFDYDWAYHLAFQMNYYGGIIEKYPKALASERAREYVIMRRIAYRRKDKTLDKVWSMSYNGKIHIAPENEDNADLYVNFVDGYSKKFFEMARVLYSKKKDKDIKVLITYNAPKILVLSKDGKNYISSLMDRSAVGILLDRLLGNGCIEDDKMISNYVKANYPTLKEIFEDRDEED